MTSDYAAVLTLAHYSGRSFAVGDDYASIRALDGGVVPPQEDLDAAWPQVQYDREIKRVRRARHAAYAAFDGPDAIYLQWQRGDATEQDWLDAVQAVKDAHPYPEATVEPIDDEEEDS